MEGLIHTITHLGVPAIAATVFAESGLLIGFFLPGDSLLFASGAFIQQGVLKINIHLFVFILFIAAAAGDSVGYAFGKNAGPSLFKRKDSRFFHKENLLKAQEFYDKHGAKTIVIARFVPFVRTFAPIVAGIAKMHYRTFVMYNLIGAALWTASFVYLGYIAGDLLKRLGVNIELMVLIIIGISFLPVALHFIKDKYFTKKPKLSAPVRKSNSDTQSAEIVND